MVRNEIDYFITNLKLYMILYFRSSSITEDGITTRFREETRENSLRRDSISRDSGISSIRENSILDIPRRERETSSTRSDTGRLSSLSFADTVAELRNKYSPANYVPTIYRKNENMSRSKSINDIGLPPVERTENSYVKKKVNDSLNSNSSIGLTNSLNNSTNNEKNDNTYLSDDDNGNRPSVSEIRKKFDGRSRVSKTPPLAIEANGVKISENRFKKQDSFENLNNGRRDSNLGKYDANISSKYDANLSKYANHGKYSKRDRSYTNGDDDAAEYPEVREAVRNKFPARGEKNYANGEVHPKEINGKDDAADDKRIAIGIDRREVNGIPDDAKKTPNGHLNGRRSTKSTKLDDVPVRRRCDEIDGVNSDVFVAKCATNCSNGIDKLTKFKVNEKEEVSNDGSELGGSACNLVDVLDNGSEADVGEASRIVRSNNLSQGKDFNKGDSRSDEKATPEVDGSSREDSKEMDSRKSKTNRLYVSSLNFFLFCRDPLILY